MMRDGTTWRRQLARDLRALEEQYGKLPMSPADLLDTELVLTLLHDYFPEEDPSAAWVLLNGHAFPAYDRLSEDGRRALAVVRLRLPAVVGKYEWQRTLRRYQTAPDAYRLYVFSAPGDAGNKSQLHLREDTSVLPERLTRMREALCEAPAWKRREPRYAPEGRYRFSTRRDTHEVDLPEDPMCSLNNDAVSRRGDQATASLPTPSPRRREPLHITFTELAAEATWMEERAPAGSAAERPWARLLREMQVRIVTAEGLQSAEEFTLDGLLHLVGMVGSGKSTLFTVLTVYCARRGLRVVLIHNDVATVLRDLAIFDSLLPAAPDVLGAVPFIGRSTRVGHLNRLHRAEALRDGGTLIRPHPGYRMLSTVCPLDGLREASKPVPLGEEPCTRLEPLGSDDEYDDDAEPSAGLPQGDSNGGAQGPNTYDCPFLPACPQHAAIREMTSARIWLTTPASLLLSSPQQPLAAEAQRLVEVVLCHADVVLVDEADLMQTQFDDRFAPMQVLIGRGDSWLDRLMRQVTAQVYHPGRPLIGRRPDLDRWLSAHRNTQSAADSLYGWLRNDAPLRTWLGSTYFTGERLLEHLEQEIGPFPAEEKHRWEEERASFRVSPLAGAATATSWQHAAYLELVPGDQAAALSTLRAWLEEALPSTAPRNVHRARVFAERLLVALVVGVLDHALQELIYEWPAAARALDVDQGSGGLFHHLADDLVRLVPEAPMGSILGFQYHDANNSGDGELRFFRMRGIGRALLYHLHDALERSDGIAGPHTVLASGTSWAPGSWRYHLHVPPTLVLLPNRHDDTALTTCSFDPLPDPEDPARSLSVSGQPSDEVRIRNLKAMAQELCRTPAFGRSMLDAELEMLPPHRRRILLVVGSYEQAEAVGDALALLREDTEREEILTLTPDADGEVGWRTPPGTLPRSLLEQLPVRNARFLVAPLQAIERGYNILVDDVAEVAVNPASGGHRVAAIGSVYFLVRPYPVPGDVHAMVQQLNAWALERVQTYTGVPATMAGLALREEASKRWNRSLRVQQTYTDLAEESRSGLLWTQLVLVWQCIGRLLRGGAAARVHFIDAKWAEQSARAGGGEDTEETSMLLGFRRVLHEALAHPDLAQRAIANALYGSAAIALDNVSNVRGKDHRDEAK